MTSRLEHGEQVEVVRWFRATFPSIMIFAIPNGGKRAISEAKRLKEEGVMPGVPDLFVPAWGLWVEMKRKKGGRLSAEQADMIDYLQTVGHTVIVCKGADEARSKIMEFVAGRS